MFVVFLYDQKNPDSDLFLAWILTWIHAHVSTHHFKSRFITQQHQFTMLPVIYLGLVECTVNISEPHLPGLGGDHDMTVYLLREIQTKMDSEAWV
jgi:hypothetical protein